MGKIRIGTRGSALALKQAKMVEEAIQMRAKLLEQAMQNQTEPIDQIIAGASDIETEIVIIKTQGDKLLDRPLIEFGGKGAFVTEFEEAILNDEIDIAVHSAKDMPIELAAGLCIGGVLPRENPADVLVVSKDKLQNDATKLPENADVIIGTGSLRRQSQLKELYTNMSFEHIRGNVPTRLKKVSNGEIDGVVLAYAGLKRLALLDEPEFMYQILSTPKVLPAGGQGIIAVECKEDFKYRQLLEQTSCQSTMYELETERQVLKELNAGCHDAIGAYAKTEGDMISLDIFQSLTSNNKMIRKAGKDKVENRIMLAKQLANELLEELSKTSI